jgi:hypothetical protein
MVYWPIGEILMLPSAKIAMAIMRYADIVTECHGLFPLTFPPFVGIAMWPTARLLSVVRREAIPVWLIPIT